MNSQKIRKEWSLLMWENTEDAHTHKSSLTETSIISCFSLDVTLIINRFTHLKHYEAEFKLQGWPECDPGIQSQINNSFHITDHSTNSVVKSPLYLMDLNIVDQLTLDL